MAEDENNGREKKWTAVRLPRELKENIDRLIEVHPELGYGGLSDFVRDAVRRRIEELNERELKSEEMVKATIKHAREIVGDIMGPEGLEIFDRKMGEISASHNGAPADIAAVKAVLRDMLGAAAERSISERIYEREVEGNV